MHNISDSDSDTNSRVKLKPKSDIGTEKKNDRGFSCVSSDSDRTISEDELEIVRLETVHSKLKGKPTNLNVSSSMASSSVARHSPPKSQSSKKTTAEHKMSTDLPMCTYGARCYRKNPEHLKRFRHPQPSRGQESSNDSVHSGVPIAKRIKLSPKGNLDTGFYFTKVAGIPESFNNGLALSLKDILSPKNGNLLASAQFNYMFELPWLMEQYPPEFRNKPILLVHGEQRMALTALTSRASRYPNITLCQAPLEIMFGTHHSKMMFLLYETGLRVVIHTSNLIMQDWHQKSQGIWVGPIFPKMDGPPSVLNGDSSTRFKRDLIDYLSAYKVNGLNEWINHIKSHDMSSAQVFIVASVPGRHTGEKKTLFGHLKLRKVLRDSGPDAKTVDKTWPVIGQFSSIGSLGTNCSQWLCNEWQSSLSATKGSGIPVKSQRLKLIYPSVDNVRISLEGYPAGASLPYGKQVAQKQPWLRDFLHQWKSSSYGRTTASPHIKTYLRTSEDSSKIAWLLLTSANLSKAAWGALEKNETQLAIRSYEIGVMFLPSSNGQTEFVHEKTGGLVTVPFDLPPVPYGPKDQPWIWDAPHTELPDRNGNMWQPS